MQWFRCRIWMLLVSDVIWNVLSMLSYCHDRKPEESRDSLPGHATLLFLFLQYCNLIYFLLHTDVWFDEMIYEPYKQ